MNRISFYYRVDKDIDNYIASIYRFTWHKHGREDVNTWVTRFLFPEELRVIRQAVDNEEATKVIRLLLIKLRKSNASVFLRMETTLEQSWREKEGRFVERLEHFFQQPPFFTSVTAYFTTLPICPYSFEKSWFMVSYRFSLEEQMRTICHELFHFMFLHYFKEYTLQTLKNKQHLEVLKEGLSVFLNTDFRDIISVPDRGYPQEKDLRNYLFQQRQHEQNFLHLLDAGIEFLNRNLPVSI